MKKETKLKKVYAWLEENGYKPHLCNRYEKSKNPKFTALHFKVSDLYDVEIKLESDNDQEWYDSHKRFNPVFIRSADKPSFIIEKIQNVIISLMTKAQVYSMLTPEQKARRKRNREKKIARLARKQERESI